MLGSSAHSQRPTDPLFESLLERRSRPYVIVFDVDGNIAFAEPHALKLFGKHLIAIQEQVGELIRRWDQSSVASQHIVGVVDKLVLRVAPLSGPNGSFYAVFFEEEARREDLKEAVTRFSFTPREVDVLDRILDGMNAAEIAEDLCIAEVTVFDHFKHISYKTKARNRADMLAKVFNWQPGLKSATARRLKDALKGVGEAT